MAAIPTGWSRLQRYGFRAIIVLSAGTLLYVFGQLVFTPWFGYEPIGAALLPNQLANNLWLLGHVVTAIPCVVLGPFLMSPKYRAKNLARHRWMGKVYVFGVLASSVLGFGLATANAHGIWAKLGFGTLAVVWFTTTFRAWRTIVARDEVAHRRWMIRSYGISLAVVTVRFIAKPPGGMDFETWYPIMTWACWVPNLIVAEICVRLTDHHGRLVKRRLPEPAPTVAPEP